MADRRADGLALEIDARSQNDATASADTEIQVPLNFEHAPAGACLRVA